MSYIGCYIVITPSFIGHHQRVKKHTMTYHDIPGYHNIKLNISKRHTMPHHTEVEVSHRRTDVSHRQYIQYTIRRYVGNDLVRHDTSVRRWDTAVRLYDTSVRRRDTSARYDGTIRRICTVSASIAMASESSGGAMPPHASQTYCVLLAPHGPVESKSLTVSRR